MDKQQLLNIIQDSENKFQVLKTIEYEGLEQNIHELERVIKEFKEGGSELLQNDVLQIGIVGQVKAGKSSFLNSLFFNGENILPKASTPMTAGLTIIEYSENNTFEVEYFNNKDWDVFVKQDEDYNKIAGEVRIANSDAPESIIIKEIENRTSEAIRSAHEMVEACSSKALTKIGSSNDVKPFDDMNELQDVLEQFVGANGEYTSVVKSLYIKMNDDRLKGLRIVDTPGVNDPVESRENRTRTFLHSCHGVFLLSSSTDFFGSGDVHFLNTRIGASGIGTVVVLASKFDSVLQDIGADKEMNGQTSGDLVDTIEMQKAKFKRRLKEQTSTVDEKLRGKMKFDTTSGIGYSIAHKSPEKWDNVESQVVKQMKRYYPNYFSTDEEIKNTFEELANIPDIREKYLEGFFMQNKETIISQRIMDFFILNKKDVYETINRILEYYKNISEELNTKTVEEIKKQREMQGRLFDSLKTKFLDTFRSFQISLQEKIKHINNNVQFQEIRQIPTENTSGPISYTGSFLGFSHNTTMSYNQVNTYELAEQISNSIDKYCKEWNEAWMKMFDTVRKEMSEKLIKSITDFEKQMMSSSFNDKYYRDLIDRSLDELRMNKELSIGKVISEFKHQGDDIASQQFYPSGTDKLSENVIPSYLERCLRDHNRNLVKQLQGLSEIIKKDVNTDVNKQLEGAIAIVEQLKKNFTEKLKKEGDAYLEMLERQMSDKKNVLDKVSKIIDCLTGLSNLYK